VGGGSVPRPGEISMAHHGLLFMDELPEFGRSALEALREPLETGRITISRAARRHDFPARFQLVAAMNPCPCGHLGNPLRACRCTPDQVDRYQGKLSGPFMDRIDVRVEVPVLGPDVIMQAPAGETSADVAARVAQARGVQMQRQGCLNAALSSAGLDTHAQAEGPALQMLKTASARLGWSGRGLHRVLRLARTIADLQGATSLSSLHVAEAIQFRRVMAGAQGAAAGRQTVSA
jgi:magnesium chelatase family protein